MINTCNLVDDELRIRVGVIPNDRNTEENIGEFIENHREKIKKISIYIPEEDALPKEIWELTELKELVICCGKLETLPREINNLVNLEVLELVGTKIIDSMNIPPEVGELKNLRVLILEDIKTLCIAPEVSNLKKLEKFKLKRVGWYHFDVLRVIFKIKTLKTLIFEDVLMDELPTEINNLTNLEKLYFSSSRKCDFPKKIGRLANLKELYVNFNFEYRLYNTFENIGYKKVMDVDEYDFADDYFWSHISKDIDKLINLEKLTINGSFLDNLYNNNLNSSLLDFKNLPNLKVLNLGNHFHLIQSIIAI